MKRHHPENDDIEIASYEDALSAGLSNSFSDWFFWNIGFRRFVSDKFKKELKLYLNNAFLKECEKELKKEVNARMQLVSQYQHHLEKIFNIETQIKNILPITIESLGENCTVDDIKNDPVQFSLASLLDLHDYDCQELKFKILSVDNRIKELKQMIFITENKMREPSEAMMNYRSRIKYVSDTNEADVEEFKSLMKEDVHNNYLLSNSIFEEGMLEAVTNQNHTGAQTIKYNRYNQLIDDLSKTKNKEYHMNNKSEKNKNASIDINTNKSSEKEYLINT